MQNEKISIISIIYDVEPFLRQCLDSMISQTYRNIEIILVVTDKEGDRSLEIAEEYADKDERIKIVQAPHGGTGDARNRGLDAASGDYIGFVDGDDFAEPDMFEKMYMNIKKYDADIAVCGKVSEYKDSSYEDIRQPLREMTAAEAFEMILDGTGFFFHCWDKLFRASLFQGLRFPADRYLEDRYVIDIAIGRAGKTVFDNEPLYHYRVRGDSLSRVKKMSEYNTDADTDFCDYVRKICPQLTDRCRYFLMYDHITCVQNYMLYFGGKNKDSEMDMRFRKHLDYVREDSKKSNPLITGKMKVKIFLCLHMRPILKLITILNKGKAEAQHEVFTR